MSEVAREFPSDVPDLAELVSLDRRGDLVWLCIQRPEVMNCLSFPTLKRLRTLCAELRGDLSIRAILISGAGDKAFCAGADLKDREKMSHDDVRQWLVLLHDAFRALELAPQAVVAAMNGVAFGGGLELALVCDLRVCAPHAQLGLTETSLAIIPGAGGTQRLPRLIGRSRAKDLILTARKIDALEAERIGLVNRIAPEGKLADAALELAATIAGNGPVAVRAAKHAIDHGCELPIEQGLEVEARAYERVLPTQDRLEALAAFAEKRKPRYSGS